MSIRNYANEIRSRFNQKDGKLGLAGLRELANAKEGVLAATTELGKLGINLKAIEDIDNPKAARSEIRRAINKLNDYATEKPENLTDSVIEALECLSSRVEILNEVDHLASMTEQHTGHHYSRNDDTALLDQQGKKVGVVLNAATLRDEAKILSKLGHAPRNRDRDEDGGLAAFFRGVSGGRTTDAIHNALSEGTDSQGGYAVPSWLLPGILSALAPASSMLTAGANIAVLQQPGDSFKIAAVDTVPTAAWRSENGALSESDPAFRGITIVPRSLAFIFKVSRELLLDAPGMDLALRMTIAQAFSKEIDRAGLIGTGTAPEIKGILNAPGINTYDMGANGAVLSNYAPIIKARRAIADDNAPAPTAIIISTREAETIDLFSDTTGQPLRRPPALETLQFIGTSQIPTNDTHGTATDASNMYLGDFTQVTFYMREALSIQRLNELYAANGEIGFACHARVDIALAYPSAICAIKGVVAA